MPASVQAETQAAGKPKRRWRQYSLRTLLCLPVVLAIVLSAVYSWPYIQRQYLMWRLQAYMERDLRTLPDKEKERVEYWLKRLCRYKGEELPLRWCGNGDDVVEYWFMHAAAIPGAERQTIAVNIVPASPGREWSSCLLYYLDSRGTMVRSVRLPIGKSVDPVNFSCDETQHGFLCLTVETGSNWGESRQFYCLSGDHVELLRCEWLDGVCEMRNGSLFFGLRETPPDGSEWQSLLDSPERLPQLRGLAALWWRGNITIPKALEDKTRRRLTELTTSSDPWVSEEARDALTNLSPTKR